MNTIIPRAQVREAVARALLLAPTAGQQAAIEAAAQALALPVEAVEQAVADEVPA